MDRILDAAAQRVRDDEWDRTHGDTEAFPGTDEGSHLMAQTAASDLRRGAFRCPSNGAQCLRGCESAEGCDLVAMAETAAELDTPVLCPATGDPCRHSCSFAPVTCPRSALMDNQRAVAEPAPEVVRADGFWWVKWAGKVHPEFPWCVREIKDGRWTVSSLAAPDSRLWVWGPYLGTEPAPAEDWADGLAIFERYQSASPSGLPGALLLDDKPARFVLRRDGVAVEALDDASWSLGGEVESQASPEAKPTDELLQAWADEVDGGDATITRRMERHALGFAQAYERGPVDRLRDETRAALDSLADGPDVGRILAQSHKRGGKEACALVRQLMGEHGVEQHDPESLNYEPSRLPALVTALWRLTGAEPDTENHPFKGETVLRYGERPEPGEGSAVFEAEQPTGAHIGGGWSIVTTWPTGPGFGTMAMRSRARSGRRSRPAMTIDEGPAVFVSIGGQVMLLPRGVLLAMHGWATPWRPWVRAAPTCSSG